MNKLIFFSVFFIFLCAAVWGDDYTWVGGSSLNWIDPDNWENITSGNIVDGYPGAIASDNVIINTTNNIAVTGTLQNLASLTIDGATLTLNGYLSSVGVLTIDTTGAQINNGVNLLTVTGTTTLNGNLAVTGDVTLGAVTLGGTGTRTLQGTTVTIGAITGAGRALTITGNAVLNGGGNNIGALQINGTGNTTTINQPITATTSVSVAGASVINANITTTGTQTYTGAVTLGGTGATRTLQGTTVTLGAITGSGNALTIHGNTVLNGGSNIDALTINNATTDALTNTTRINAAISAVSVTIGRTNATGIISIYANITTTGTGTTPQYYYGPVTLNADVNFTGVSGTIVRFNNTVNGTGLTVTNAIARVVVSATTTGNQEYKGPFTFGSAATTSTTLSATGSTITFGGIVVSNTTSTTARNLTVSSGTVVFNGQVGANTNNGRVSTLTVSGNTTINANVYTTGAGTAQQSAQQYNGPVLLGGNIIFTGATGSTVRFVNTVNNSDANARSLTVTTANARFDGTVGNANPIAGVSVTGTSAINTTSITTTGAQTYTGAVTLGGAAGLRTLEGTTVTMGEITGGGHPLTINGNAVLSGGGSGIGALQINGIGNTATINGSITNTTSVTINATGTTTINAANITTTGNGIAQHYYGPVVLSANVIFTGAANSTVQFANTVRSNNATARSLTVTTANAIFDGTVGGAGNPIAGVSVAGTSAINADITTTGAQTYTGAVTLGADVNLSANAVSLIRFGSTVRSSSVTARTLTISTANVRFDGAVGIAGSPISTLTVTAGTAAINADITTTGNQSYTGAVTIGGTGARKLESPGVIAIGTGLSSASNDVIINANEITVVSGGLQASDNNVSLESNENVTITGVITAGTLTLAGNIVYTLNNPGNNIAVLQTATPYPEEISYTDTNGFSIETGLQADTSITLESGGTVTQGGEIITETLTLAGNAGFTLNNAGNNIETLQTRAVLPNIYPTVINYTDADDFNIGTEGLQAVTRVALKTAGKVTIGENINVAGSSINSGYHEENAAVYIEANELEGNGEITFTIGSGHWACAYITQSTGFTGDVNENGIHYHTTDGRHIVYRSGDISTFTSSIYGNHPLFSQLYLYIQADNDNLGLRQDIFTSGSGNIYIIDVDDDNPSNSALTRIVSFNTVSGVSGGHIEIWGKYTAEPTGVLTLAPGIGGVVLIDAEINLAGNFNTNGTTLTVAGTSGSEINAANIILGSGIEGVSGFPSDLTLAAGTIHITGTAGTPSPLKDVTINGELTLTNTTLSASSFSFNNGQVTLVGNIELETNNGDIEFNYNTAAPSINGNGNLVMTAGNGDISILGQAGQSSSHIGDIHIISAGDVTFSNGIYAGDVSVNNTDDVTFSSVVYAGDITVNNADEITFSSGVYAGDISVNTAGDVTFSGDVYAEDITVDNTNDVTFSNDIHAEDISVNSASDVTFSNDIYAEDISVNDADDVTFSNDIHAGDISVNDADEVSFSSGVNAEGISISNAGDVTFSGDVNAENISVNDADDVAFSGDVNAGDVSVSNAGDVTLSGIVSSGNIAINNGGLYTQNGNVTVNGNFNQTGTGNVELDGGITINNAAEIGFVSEITLGSSVAFNAPVGGIVRLKSLVDGSDFHTLTLNGGSASSPLLVEQVNTNGMEIDGSLNITANSYVKINSGSTLTQNGNKGLTLGTNTVLDTSAASWHMGAAGTSNDFAGTSGSLILGENSKLITHDLNLTGSALEITNTDWVIISVNGSAQITDDVKFSGDYPQLIIEMNGNGTQTLTTEVPLGSLHIGTNSHTIIETGGQLATDNPSTIIITGRVKIFAVNAPAGLDAGDYDIVMYAGLTGNRNLTNYTHNGSDSIRYTRWENVSAPIAAPPYSSPPDINSFVFRQNTGGKVSFQRDPADLTNLPVFFEIAGNTMWREFVCSVPGAVVQFSRHPHHHVVLEDFSIGNQSSTSADHSDYVTITRLTDDDYINFPYLYDSSVMGQPPLTSAGANVGDLGNYALPVYYPPLDLKNAVQSEKEKYWNINFITVSGPAQKPLDNFRYVRIFFSHAYNQRIPIETSSMHLDAVPYYRPLTGEGHFNFDWIELRKILYSFTEDSSGDGRLDRIRVQTNVRLNGDFSAFEVNVEGYQIDTSIGTNGFLMVNALTGYNDDEDSFYIYLRQVPYIDGGSTPLWSVMRNESLKDLLTESSSVGDPVIDVDMMPFDTIPPRISHTLTLPGHPQTYVRMSEPVLSLPGGNISDAQAVERSGPYIFTWKYFPYDSEPVHYTMPVISANLGYLLNMPSSLDIETLSRLKNIFGDTTSSETNGYFRMDNIIDQGQRAMDWHDSSVDPAFYIYYQPPKYPLNWAYTEYAKVYGNSHLAGRGFLTPDFSIDETEALKSDGSSVPLSQVFMPPNKMLTVEMMTLIAQGRGDEVTPQNFASYSNPSANDTVIRRVTDVLVSLTPASGDSENYFAWPVWARYQNNANPDNASLSGDFWSQRNTDNGVIWNFDGTAFLEARGFDLQARMNSVLTGSLELFWTADIPTEYRIPQADPVRGRSTGGLWLPYPGDLHNNRLLYYFAPLYEGSAVNQSGASSPANPPLFNFMLNGENSSGKKMEFVLRINGSSPSDLFVARLDIPRTGAIPENWYYLVRPFGFDIQDIRLQRGGVTVLNNVINSDARESAFIRYHLVRPGRVTVQVYTLDGTLVKSLRRNEYREAGEWTDSWDGTNNSGRAVARGMYFVRVVAPDIDEIRKIMVVR